MSLIQALDLATETALHRTDKIIALLNSWSWVIVRTCPASGRDFVHMATTKWYWSLEAAEKAGKKALINYIVNTLGLYCYIDPFQSGHRIVMVRCHDVIEG